MAQSLGSIAPGYYADMVAVEGDPFARYSGRDQESSLGDERRTGGRRQKPSRHELHVDVRGFDLSLKELGGAAWLNQMRRGVALVTGLGDGNRPGRGVAAGTARAGGSRFNYSRSEEKRRRRRWEAVKSHGVGGHSLPVQCRRRGGKSSR